MDPPHTDNSLFSFKDPDDYARFRDVLMRVGYTDGGILEVLGYHRYPSIRDSDVPLLLRRTKGGSALETLIRLFLIEVSCDAQSVRSAIHPVNIESLIQAGLIRIDHSMVSASVKLLPFQNLLLVFDLPRMLHTDLGKHYVMGIGGSTISLANLTIRRRSGLTLDLGSGCGIQGLLAAGHSDRILAVDRNPRAVRLAAFNAKLNGIGHLDSREGDLFEPVEGFRFDLIVANPPFVISPETRYIYRDSGLRGDEVCRRIVREAPAFLNQDGFCQVLCNWIERAGEDWQRRLQNWAEGSGCDVWVMRFESRDAATYASTWIRDTEKRPRDDRGRRLDEWLDYYEQHGIETVGAGLITMRKRSGRTNWFRTDEAPEKMAGPSGQYVLRGFVLRDFVETVRDDSALLDTCLEASPDTRLERELTPAQGGWSETATQLILMRGMKYRGTIDPFVAKMVMSCNAQTPLRDLLAEMAESLGRDVEEIAPHFCGIVRGLVEKGFLLPAGISAKE